jgi:hypothetical protein
MAGSSRRGDEDGPRAPGLDVSEDVVALHGIDLAVRTPQSPERADLAPERRTLDFTFEHGMTRCSVPEVLGHQIIVFEGSP